MLAGGDSELYQPCASCTEYHGRELEICESILKPNGVYSETLGSTEISLFEEVVEGKSGL